jgi:glyoxylase-like metal-dependent hydrolase (beta-lactamase superfamily II)
VLCGPRQIGKRPAGRIDPELEMKKSRFAFSKTTGMVSILVPVFLGMTGMAAPLMAQMGGELHTLHAQGDVYMVVGPNYNSAVQIGKDGVLVVDPGPEANSAALIAEIRKLSPTGSIRFVIDTNMREEHAGANAQLSEAGKQIVGGNFAGQVGAAEGGVSGGAVIVAHENVLNRMSATPPAGQKQIPPAAWPEDTFFGNQKNLFFNGEALELIHIPAATTDGDVLVFFRRSDVIAAGDIFTPDRYPYIDLARGGNIQGIVDGLNRLIAVTIPADKQEGGTYVIPGRGRLCDQADVVEYRDMATIVRDRVQDMVKKGMTLEQVKASRPTRDYDPEYGADKGTWTTEMFVDAVYKSLKK